VANIYAQETAPVEIACSACWRHFEVAFSIPGTGLQETIGKCSSLAEAIQKGEIHYGDPPNYGNCRDGASMGCYDLQVLQYWSRANEKHSWLHDSRLEIELPDAREMRRLDVERIVVNFPIFEAASSPRNSWQIYGDKENLHIRGAWRGQEKPHVRASGQQGGRTAHSEYRCADFEEGTLC